MILRKYEDLSFCQHINDDDRSANVSEIARHLSIATNSHVELSGFLEHSDEIESSFIKSLHIFTKEKLPPRFVSGIPTKYKPLNVLDFENSNVSYDFENLGCLIYLKYLSFRNTQVRSLPKSIGKFMNLETLDLRESEINEVPKEVIKLRKLRHLLGNMMSRSSIKERY
jgi:disease resistance protein RPM1